MAADFGQWGPNAPSTAGKAPKPPAPACMAGATAVNRAMEWVKADLHYCQAPYGEVDPDKYCWPWEGESHICDRESNSEWNAYRSDCSGLVSWAWQIPAPGDTTRDFAPVTFAITSEIPAESLQPGDAVNVNNSSDEHVMLFKQWVTPGKYATFIQEPGCSVDVPHASENTYAVEDLHGSTITVVGVNTFTAIRYNALGCHASTGGGGGGGGGASTSGPCFSETLNENVPSGSCVISKFDDELWICENGKWDLDSVTGDPCAATYPNGKGGTADGCHSDTLGREVPDNSCVQSEVNDEWYQCANGTWVDRWTDPTQCNGVYPL
jgi:hypothetical protein